MNNTNELMDTESSKIFENLGFKYNEAQMKFFGGIFFTFIILVVCALTLADIVKINFLHIIAPVALAVAVVYTIFRFFVYRKKTKEIPLKYNDYYKQMAISYIFDTVDDKKDFTNRYKGTINRKEVTINYTNDNNSNKDDCTSIVIKDFKSEPCDKEDILYKNINYKVKIWSESNDDTNFSTHIIIYDYVLDNVIKDYFDRVRDGKSDTDHITDTLFEDTYIIKKVLNKVGLIDEKDKYVNEYIAK